MSHFNKLTESAKIAISKTVEHAIAISPKELYLPVAPAGIWYSVLSKLNVRLRGDGLPFADEIGRAVLYLESQLGTPGVCERCGAN
ncbi:hypothetical protein [Hymenobacter terricola]|uniref:hypothetical protein n=1 Tax=Hymenobacter terricola TaxID=2819236 RepID=UPI001B30ED08|nr:hypothetical protein [Hymenobacter terricola]